jgi:hypothetical protein
MTFFPHNSLDRMIAAADLLAYVSPGRCVYWFMSTLLASFKLCEASGEESEKN